MNKRLKVTLLFISMIIALIVLPFVLKEFYRIIAIEIILLGIFAMSLNLMLGYAGLVSFGHAAFFGAGGYVLGCVLLKWGGSLWTAFGLAILVTVGMSILIGYIAIRSKGIYFAIITLAFSEVLYRIAFTTQFLGGSDGMIGIPRPDLIFPGGIRFSIVTSLSFYFLVLVYAFITYAVMWKITHSPFGKVLEAIRENEGRVAFIGYNVKVYKMFCFSFSAMFAGLSGAIYSLFKGFADTEQLHFILSGKVILMTLIGGIGTLLGPVFGSAFIVIIETFASRYFEYYLIVIGLAFVAVVIFLPKGIYGTFLNFWNKER